MCVNYGAYQTGAMADARRTGNYHYALGPDSGGWDDVRFKEGKQHKNDTLTWFLGGRRLPDVRDAAHGGPSGRYVTKGGKTTWEPTPGWYPAWYAGDDRVAYRKTSAGSQTPISKANIPIYIRGRNEARYGDRQSAQSSNVVRGSGPEKAVTRTALTGSSGGSAQPSGGATALTGERGITGGASRRSKEEAARRAGSALNRSAGGS